LLRFKFFFPFLVSLILSAKTNILKFQVMWTIQDVGIVTNCGAGDQLMTDGSPLSPGGAWIEVSHTTRKLNVNHLASNNPPCSRWLQTGTNEIKCIVLKVYDVNQWTDWTENSGFKKKAKNLIFPKSYIYFPDVELKNLKVYRKVIPELLFRCINQINSHQIDRLIDDNIDIYGENEWLKCCEICFTIL